MGTRSVRVYLETVLPSCSTNVFFSEENLERALQKQTNISEDAIIAYLPDGRRLTTDNVRELAGAVDDVRVLLLVR